MKPIRIILFYIIVILPSWLFGQDFQFNDQNLKFKKISLKQGLSQSSVICIMQDQTGFLWFGTRDGLNKYDGNTFKIFRHNSLDSTSLGHSSIKSMFQDDYGNLWVGTRSGLNKFDADNDKFIRYTNLILKEGNYENEIWCIEGDDRDHIWISTNYGLKRMNVKSKEIEHFRSTPKDKSSLSSNLVRALETTSDGNLWIKTINGIDFFDSKTRKITRYSFPDGFTHESNFSYLSVIYEDSNQNIWLGLENGLAKYSEKENRFEFFTMPSETNRAIKDEVRSIEEDHIGNLWVGTYKGIYIIDSTKSSILHIRHSEYDSYSLSQNSIYCTFEDSTGDMWIGTYAGGVNYYDRSFDRFQHFSAGPNIFDLNYKVISSIIQDEENNLWIGTEGGGLNYYDQETGRFDYYIHKSNDPYSISTDNVKTILSDHNGNLWIGTHNGGLNFLNTKSQPFKFIRYSWIPDDSTSLSNNRVISLFEDDQNKIWIGTSGGGINVMTPETNTITRINGASEVVGNIIFTISHSRDKNFLLVGGDKGLARLNKFNRAWFPIHFKAPEKSISAAILCTYVDQGNYIWIGTEGDGLYRYNSHTGKSERFGIPHGLPNEVVYGILPDNDNNLWLSTNLGLSKLNLETLEFKNFDGSDGLQGNEFNYGACMKSKDGKMFFGGTNGFNIFDPSKITDDAFIPPVSITAFKVNNTLLPEASYLNNQITLKYHQNVLNFDFVALSYSQPNKNQYAHILEGFDKDWNYISNKKSATYTNLDAGTYKFRVKAANKDGLWNEEGATLTLTILPPPWQTWWAYLIYAICTIAALMLIRKYFLQRIHDRNELRNERLEKERIEKVNQMKLQLFTDISHDFRTPLTLIMGPLERMIKMNVGDDFIQKQHQTMHRNARVLMELIEQLLDFRKTESGSLKLQVSENNIVDFVEDIKLAFDELARKRSIDFSLNSQERKIPVWFDKIMLKKIMYNLLSNAFKFTPDHGRIEIQIEKNDHARKNKPLGEVRIIISDSGKGIPKEQLSNIFERFYQYGKRTGTGIGLALTKRLVKLHQGSIKVRSKENNGAIFTTTLPLGRTHFLEEQILANDSDDRENFQNSLYQTPLEMTAKPKSVTLQPEEEFDNGKSTILVVEDNDDVRHYIKSIFSETYNIFEAVNGKEALIIARSTPLHLIVSDLMMPMMDGMELCNEIKSNIRTSHIPVVLLTAKTSREHKHAGFSKGADAYITKPFDANILKIRVDNLIKSRQLLIEKYKKDIILNPKEITSNTPDETFLKKAISIVEENFSNPEFNVQSLVRQMNMSRSVFYRKLRSLTDQSITEFIRVIKLKKAAHLMINSTMTISEIAYFLGFNDQKHFRESFKKQFNKLPSKYRIENSSDNKSVQ